MKTVWKIVLGILSLEPLIFLATFFFWLIPSFVSTTPSGESHTVFQKRFDLLFPLAMATGALVFVLLVLYTILLARRPDLHVAEKVGIPLGLLATNGLLLPLVWWWYIWRESNLTKASRSSAS